MDFRILGPLEVSSDDGPLTLGGPKQRAILAHLVLRSNQRVPADELVDALWGEEPPETARSTIQTYVYRLRKLLGEERIEGRASGYILHAEPEEIDASRFESLIRTAKTMLISDPAAAAGILDDALSLWRGPALGDLAEEEEASLRGEIARLEELRLAAIEHRISAELQMGRHSTVVSDLEALTARYPLRERLWADLILALYRAGRQAEALDAYRRAREVLAHELGADPSPELQHLHEQILAQAPELRGPLRPTPAPAFQASRGDLEPGAEFAGYRIDRIIGRGGMGVVYLAEHEGLKRKVALKLLAPELAEDPRFRERFGRESQLAASIDHPNVIPIYEAGEADGRLYIAMRFVEGRDLRTLLHEQGKLDTAQTSRIVGQVAAALDAAHELGLVHRDVKPANVLIARQRGTEAGTHGYLTDFGLTKRAASDSGITGTGQFVGTLDYAAPEQFRGEVADARTDVYSLGCVLFECLAGHPPFRAENDAALMFAHLMEAPPPLAADRPDLPADIDEVVATAMAKAPKDRYPSAGTFASRASAALGFSVDDHPSSGPAHTRRSRRSPSRRRRRVTIGAIAAILAVVLVAALLTVLNGGTAKAGFPPGISIVDQVTGEALRRIPTSAIREPAEAIYANGRFWVHNLDPNSFVEVNPRDGSVLTQIAAPFQDVGAFTVVGDALWVTGPSVVKIDIGLRREVDRFDLPHPTHGVVMAGGSLWVTMPSANTTLRLDPGTGEVEHRFDALPGSLALAYGDGAVWTAGWSPEFGGFTGEGGVNRIDPDTNSITKTPLVLSADCCPVVAGGGFGWTTDQTKGVVYKIDPSGQVVATLPSGSGASIGSYSDGVVWVGNSDVGKVVGIDALTSERRSFSFEHPLQGLAAGSDVLLVALGPGRTYEDVIDGLEGHVARLFAQLGRLEIPDPAVLTSQLGFSVEFATCAKLLNYPDAPPPEGWNLRPEVAAAMPDISSDDRTYTFEIRPGYRFSPPSNEPITAETFRYSIERAIAIPPVPFGATPRYLINDIEGESEFLRGDADHISGLRAEGDTLTIELREPSADFLHRLSYPWFCPVPTDSPLVAGGAGAFVGYPHRTPQAVPSAGPYYIADHLSGEYTILKRNPNYSGPRPHAFDAIALREGIDPGVAVGLVERGSWDGITHVFDPLLTPTGPVAEKYGDEGTSEGSLWYDAVPWPLLGYLIFNASRPTFSDPDVRRAAALALDRESVAALWGHAPTDQLLPPVTSGFVDRELYPLDGSGLDEARSLMDGRRATAVFGVDGGNDRARQEAEIVRDDLSAIGISVKIEEFNNVEVAASQRGADIDIIASGFEFGSWDPASFLINVLKYGTPHSWLPTGVLDELGELLPLTGSERRTTALALADRLATEDVPIAADLSGVTPTLLAPSIGCRVVPPFGYGVDLAALCPSQG